MPVTVTETAARRIEQIIGEHGFEPSAMKLRVGVKGGGCSGFNYTLDLTEVQRDSDESWNFTYPRASGTMSADATTDATRDASSGGGVATATATSGDQCDRGGRRGNFQQALSVHLHPPSLLHDHVRMHVG